MKTYLVIAIIILFFGKILPLDTTINTGNILVDMNYDGRIQLFQPGDLDTLNLYSLSILVATSPSTVFDYWQDAGTQDSTMAYFDSSSGLVGLYGSFNNSLHSLPPNVLIKTYVTGWTGTTYALIKYVIINKETSAINAMAGVEIISQLDGIQGFDTVNYIDSSKVIDIYKQNHLGFRLLSGNLKSLTSFEFFDGFENDSSYYKWMNHDTLDTQYNSGPDGPVTIASQDFQTINPGDSITIYYGMALGSSLSAVESSLDTVLSRYNGTFVTGVKSNNNIGPLSFKLNQNYPNPFNPGTTISFTIPTQERVTLKVYNILGMEVATIINDVKPAGNYSFRFNTKDIPSGIYFYEMNAGNFRDVKKMILLK
jgi:Secretion system C-terminal sorting domain